MDQDTKKEFENLGRMINNGFEETKSVLRKEFREGIEEVKTELREDIVKESRKLELKLKDHFDEKLVETKGDIIVAMRREDQKVNELVDILREKEVLDDDDVKKLISIRPFVLKGAE